MPSDRLIAALDIGTAKVTALIAECPDAAAPGAPLVVLGVGQARTTGLRRGTVADLDGAARAIQKAMQDAERMANICARPVVLGIGADHARAMTSHGVVPVATDEVTREDVERVNAVAQAQPIPPDRELLHTIPQLYRVDRTADLRDPVGMPGTRLETEMYLITVDGTSAEHLRRATARAGHPVDAVLLAPLASALAVLSEEEQEYGVALIDIGADTTNLVVYHEGRLRHLGRVSSGGHTISNDVALGLSLGVPEAERLKERYGCAYEPLVEPLDPTPITIQGDRQIPRELLAHIIHQRLDEIFDFVARDIAAAGLAGQLGSGIVLTGGTAALPGIVELARDVFGTAVRIGQPAMHVDGFRDAVDAPRFSTAVGLALYGAEQLRADGPRGPLARLPGPSDARSVVRRITHWLQDFF